MDLKRFLITAGVILVACITCVQGLGAGNIDASEACNYTGSMKSAPDIDQSHHDFDDASWANYETCRPCHIPHNANTTIVNSPLWSHDLSTASYTVYSRSTMDAAPGQPTGTTKLCLSCHDGTVAVENFAGNHNGSWYPSFGKIGTDLSKHHPIGFVYNSALAAADGELYDPSTTQSGLGGTIEEDLLDNGKMGCVSCHDVHISRNKNGCLGCHFVAPGVTTRTLSIWKDNTGSALCLTCHKK